jgi:hypothetical protein
MSSDVVAGFLFARNVGTAFCLAPVQNTPMPDRIRLPRVLPGRLAFPQACGRVPRRRGLASRTRKDGAREDGVNQWNWVLSDLAGWVPTSRAG